MNLVRVDPDEISFAWDHKSKHQKGPCVLVCRTKVIARGNYNSMVDLYCQLTDDKDEGETVAVDLDYKDL